MKEKHFVWAAIVVLAFIALSAISLSGYVDLEAIHTMQKDIILMQLGMYK